MISYQLEKTLSLQEFITVLDDSGLGQRRPMHDLNHLEHMLINSNMVIVAREGEQVLRVLRGLTDFCYRTFNANLAVISDRQGEGNGSGPVQFARSIAPEVRLILFSAEDSIGFYDKLEFYLHEYCYQLKPHEPLC